jgi:hypothetical protein
MRTPSKHQLEKAQTLFLKKEPRDLFYKVANELVSLAIENKTSISVAESISVLLQTWNKQVYRFKKFTEDDLILLEQNIIKHDGVIKQYRGSSIRPLSSEEESILTRLFQDFENPRGPVGAAKTLHLLAPNFFPLWDDDIAKNGYGIRFGRTGTNGQKYLSFIKIIAKQVSNIRRHQIQNPLKRLDEFNYCKYSKKWL